jgi:hypothetical protein
MSAAATAAASLTAANLTTSGILRRLASQCWAGPVFRMTPEGRLCLSLQRYLGGHWGWMQEFDVAAIQLPSGTWTSPPAKAQKRFVDGKEDNLAFYYVRIITSPRYAPTKDAIGRFFFATLPLRHGLQSSNCCSIISSSVRTLARRSRAPSRGHASRRRTLPRDASCLAPGPGVPSVVVTLPRPRSSASSAAAFAWASVPE